MTALMADAADVMSDITLERKLRISAIPGRRPGPAVGGLDQ